MKRYVHDLIHGDVDWFEFFVGTRIATVIRTILEGAAR